MRMTVGDDILDFSYDANGAPLTMTCNGTVYYYITNLQGDVMAVESATGSTVAQYAYDAWGNIIAMMGTLAELNPLRYRGHVYDQETGFYYVSSRYYDPEIGRFINADAAIELKIKEMRNWELGEQDYMKMIQHLILKTDSLICEKGKLSSKSQMS